MQKWIVLFLTMALGVLIAYGISHLVSLLWPAAAMPVFAILGGIWIWFGLIYCGAIRPH